MDARELFGNGRKLSDFILCRIAPSHALFEEWNLIWNVIGKITFDWVFSSVELFFHSGMYSLLNNTSELNNILFWNNTFVSLYVAKHPFLSVKDLYDSIFRTNELMTVTKGYRVKSYPGKIVLHLDYERSFRKESSRPEIK